jgi:hypothetical protein
MHNWAATTFGWGSVMDYLAPNIQVKDGRLDFSDAYPEDVGSYDRLMIQWGYTPASTAPSSTGSCETAMRRNRLSAGYGRALGGIRLGCGSGAMARDDSGRAPDPSRPIRSGQLAPGDWVTSLQQRFNLAYLYHRFAIQTAQQFIGGQFQTNAVAGDGQKPVADVPAAQQGEPSIYWSRLSRPKNLDVPDRILAALVPPPSGTMRSQEQFASEAGNAFSLWTAARVLAGLIGRPLLEPERAAKLSLASGRGALTLDAVISRLVAATWGAPTTASNRTNQLLRASQRVVLDAMLDLASRPTSPEVPGRRLRAPGESEKGIEEPSRDRPGGRRATQLAERDLREFLDEPETRKTRPPRPPVPPGRPIGD